MIEVFCPDKEYIDNPLYKEGMEYYFESPVNLVLLKRENARSIDYGSIYIKYCLDSKPGDTDIISEEYLNLLFSEDENTQKLAQDLLFKNFDPSSSRRPVSESWAFKDFLKMILLGNNKIKIASLLFEALSEYEMVKIRYIAYTLNDMYEIIFRSEKLLHLTKTVYKKLNNVK